jgi:hypothetical protein
MPGETLCIGVGFTECHAAHPWSAQRWDFVTRGMQGQVDQLWWGDTARIAHALHEAHSVQWRCEPHADKALARLSDLLNAHGVPPSHRAQEQTPLFEPVERYCPSFSQWWRLTRLRV